MALSLWFVDESVMLSGTFCKRSGEDNRVGDGPNTVSEITVSNTELSEISCPHRLPGREVSEFLSALYLRAKAKSPSFFAEPTEFAPKLSEAQ